MWLPTTTNLLSRNLLFCFLPSCLSPKFKRPTVVPAHHGESFSREGTDEKRHRNEVNKCKGTGESAWNARRHLCRWKDPDFGKEVRTCHLRICHTGGLIISSWHHLRNWNLREGTLHFTLQASSHKGSFRMVTTLHQSKKIVLITQDC